MSKINVNENNKVSQREPERMANGDIYHKTHSQKNLAELPGFKACSSVEGKDREEPYIFQGEFKNIEVEIALCKNKAMKKAYVAKKLRETINGTASDDFYYTEKNVYGGDWQLIKDQLQDTTRMTLRSARSPQLAESKENYDPNVSQKQCRKRKIEEQEVCDSTRRTRKIPKRFENDSDYYYY